MDELLREFLTETQESIDVVDVELVRFEQDPNNAKILDNVFRLVHTIKGTCGFLDLPRLEALTHAAEALMGQFRDGMPVTREAVTLILATIDRVKVLLDAIERNRSEEAGDDRDLIAELNRMAGGPRAEARTGQSAKPAAQTTVQVVPARAEEVALDELERAFRDAPGPAPQPATAPPPQATAAPTSAPTKPGRAGEQAASREDAPGDSKLASQSIRVHVDALENLMTMV